MKIIIKLRCEIKAVTFNSLEVVILNKNRDTLDLPQKSIIVIIIHCV